jgi:hypothetical protein
MPLEIYRIVFVLKAGQKIVRKTKKVRFAPTLPALSLAEPQIQHIVKVDV